jgi:hypothetical protein
VVAVDTLLLVLLEVQVAEVAVLLPQTVGLERLTKGMLAAMQ